MFSFIEMYVHIYIKICIQTSTYFSRARVNVYSILYFCFYLFINKYIYLFILSFTLFPIIPIDSYYRTQIIFLIIFVFLPALTFFTASSSCISFVTGLLFNHSRLFSLLFQFFLFILFYCLVGLYPIP